MRLPKDFAANHPQQPAQLPQPPQQQQQQQPTAAAPAPIHGSSATATSWKRLGKENVEPLDSTCGASASAAVASAATDASANLLWLLDFRLDNILPNDGQPADKHGPMEVSKKSTEVASGSSGHGQGGGCSSKPAVKPPYTYTELIEQALSEKGPLTVAEIYRWISERFPYFKANDDRWKNSVRHNLSISPHFRKSVKARTGTGHLWTLALPPSARTVAANLAQKAKESHTSEEAQDETARACLELLRAEGAATSSAVDATAVEYEAPASITVQVQHNGRCSPLTFEKAAEMMLATEHGANRVQVEFLARPIQHMPHLDANGSCSPEFLNPIPRDELMEESGLFALQMDDPFANLSAQHHHANQIQIQVSNETRMEGEDVTFDPFPHSETDTSMLFGDDYPLSYSYEIL